MKEKIKEVEVRELSTLKLSLYIIYEGCKIGDTTPDLRVFTYSVAGRDLLK